MVKQMTNGIWLLFVCCHYNILIFCSDVCRLISVLHKHLRKRFLFLRKLPAYSVLMRFFLIYVHKYYFVDKNTILDCLHYYWLCFRLYGLHMASNPGLV